MNKGKRWKNAGWHEEMRVAFDFNHMMADFIGRENGIEERELEELSEKGREVLRDIRERRNKGLLPFLDLPYQSTRRIKNLVEEVKRDFEDFVLIGIGGSFLGPLALHQALNPPNYNLLSKKERKGSPRVHFIDNVDPDNISALIKTLDLKKTLVNVITKSGETSETVANFLVIRGALQGAMPARQVARHIVVTTDPKKGDLRRIAKKEGYRSLEIPQGVGGRYSVFTAVGLFPAAIAGIEIDELLSGASYMDRRCSVDDIHKNPACMGALLQYISHKRKNKNIFVMMPYANSLIGFSDWFCQIWAESLGKRFSLEGKEVYNGQTPVRALGASDQHSQLQLYIEGPSDKTVTFVRVERFREEVIIPRSFPDMEGTSYLGGRTLNELIHAEQIATELALAKPGRPSWRILIPEVNAFAMGQLLYYFEAMTLIAAGLYGVNPLDQPGVEEGKRFTYGMMGKIGYQEKRQEVERWKSREGRYIL